MPKLANILLLAGCAVCLLQIWLPAYYLTGDGPCHLYNAQILHDLWINKNVAFYSRFFKLNYQPNPNWFTTLVLALLLFIAKGAVAEKIFLTLYVLLYVGGFYFLVKKISENTYWLLVVFIFVFTQTLAKGFYNFSFSIAFYFWVVWAWLRLLEKSNVGNAALFFIFSFLLFFTHLLPFVFASFTCAALTGSYAATQTGTTKSRFVFFQRNGVLFILLLSPFILLVGWFIQNEGGMQLKMGGHFYRLVELAQFKYIINEVQREAFLAEVAAITLLCLFCISFMVYKNRFKLHKYDGFLVTFLFVLFICLFFPDDFMGRVLAFSVRVQLFVLILTACCIAYRFPSSKLKNAGALILFGCFIGLSAIRISNRLTASLAEKDYLSAAKYIKPYSVVLPLDFSPNGTDGNGYMIADRNCLFSHALGYMGTGKPLIILDNFEANMGYFPLTWVEHTNPYYHLGRDEGIEGWPPYAVIEEYKQTAGVTVDYIVMWCYAPSYLQNGHFKKLYDEINAGYHLVYTSPTARTMLYGKN